MKVLIIGGNAAGMSAASAVRRLSKESEIVVLEKDAYISYASCSLPYYISDDVKSVEKLFALTADEARRERGIDVRLFKEATEIDIEGKRVIAKDVKSGFLESYDFDKLVIATGASPIIPNFEGVNLKGIFTIRNINDGIAIKNFISDRRPKEAVIVGGGYIGLEMSESLRKRGLNVTVVEKMDRLLGTMEKEVSEKVESVLQKEGVTVMKNVSVKAFYGKEGYVRSVALDSNEIPCDIVILSIGVRPNSDLAKRAGIELGVAESIRIDNFMRTNYEDVYACGDCAEAIHLVTGKRVYIPLGTTANRQGRIAGENVAGKKTEFKGVLGTAMTKVFELEVARTGLSSIEAEREKMDFVKVTIEGSSRSKAYPSGKPILVTYIVERSSGMLLGAQLVGEEGVALRVDTVASCIYNRMTVYDVASIDLGYAPPFATVWDPILIAANEAIKRL